MRTRHAFEQRDMRHDSEPRAARIGQEVTERGRRAGWFGAGEGQPPVNIEQTKRGDQVGNALSLVQMAGEKEFQRLVFLPLHNGAGCGGRAAIGRDMRLSIGQSLRQALPRKGRSNDDMIGKLDLGVFPCVFPGAVLQALHGAGPLRQALRLFLKKSPECAPMRDGQFIDAGQSHFARRPESFERAILVGVHQRSRALTGAKMPRNRAIQGAIDRVHRGPAHLVSRQRRKACASGQQPYHLAAGRKPRSRPVRLRETTLGEAAAYPFRPHGGARQRLWQAYGGPELGQYLIACERPEHRAQISIAGRMANQGAHRLSCNADKLSRCTQIIDREGGSLQTLARSHSGHISVSPAPGINKAEKMFFIEIKSFNLVNQTACAFNMNNQEKLVVAGFPAANGE